ncbi:conserved hypothetical protein [Tenacibaculum sp. 190524A02b]|uniref:Uncharacterized protein n=1 Tax=Tenacibaculum vairaonense TaxID=3137860 RepID=A0ABM9PIQ2_9FLAO
MANCFDNIPLEDLTQCVNSELAAGTSETEVYAAVSEHIDSFPSLPPLGGDPATTTLEGLATLNTDIAFTTGKGFFKLQAQVDTGEVKDELVGNKGNKKVKSSYEFFLTNTSARNIGFIRQFKNTPMVFIVKEKTGRYRVIGSKTIPVYMDEASGTTGKGSEDDNGWNISVSATSGNPAPVYTGNIVLPSA